MKVALVVTENFSAWHFRRGLLKAAVKSGLDTYLITPPGEYDALLTGLGVTHIPAQVDRVINPWQDLRFMGSLYATCRKYKFDIVHNISIKPNIYGALAARCAGIRCIVGSVTGLGNVYMDEIGLPYRLLRPWVTNLYRFAFSLTDRVWFQNPEDVQFFVARRILSPEKAVLIRGSGVDLQEFSPFLVSAESTEGLRHDLGLGESTMVITMVSRALKSKGVEDFIDACEMVGLGFPCVTGLLVGDAEDGNPLSLPKEYLSGKGSAHFRWLGWRHDIREIMKLSDIVVLPSRYREGAPKSLLEAMAMSKPVITTDVPGCRDIVEDGENGYVVPPRNPSALAGALRQLILDEPKRLRFGEHSRCLVLKYFDMEKINKAILGELYQWRN